MFTMKALMIFIFSIILTSCAGVQHLVDAEKALFAQTVKTIVHDEVMFLAKKIDVASMRIDMLYEKMSDINNEHGVFTHSFTNASKQINKLLLASEKDMKYFKEKIIEIGIKLLSVEKRIAKLEKKK